MSPRLIDGWVVVEHDAPLTQSVEIGVSTPAAIAWAPAFRSYLEGVRVMQVRPPEGMRRDAVVYLSVDGVEQALGRLS